MPNLFYFINHRLTAYVYKCYITILYYAKVILYSFIEFVGWHLDIQHYNRRNQLFMIKHHSMMNCRDHLGLRHCHCCDEIISVQLSWTYEKSQFSSTGHTQSIVAT